MTPHPASPLVEALRKAAEALRPIARGVFNDNGDLTVSFETLDYDQIVAAWRAEGRALRLLAALDACAALASEAASQVPADGWRPIASAPKDGTEIIGYRPDQGTFVFRWSSMEEHVPKDRNGDPTEDYDDSFECWFHDRWGWMEGECTPTLWQHYPAAPDQEGPADGK